jgi:hypothetical protein
MAIIRKEYEYYTVNDLVAELQKLQEAGEGDKVVLIPTSENYYGEDDYAYEYITVETLDIKNGGDKSVFLENYRSLDEENEVMNYLFRE